jgi:hypothetical protein
MHSTCRGPMRYYKKTCGLKADQYTDPTPPTVSASLFLSTTV